MFIKKKFIYPVVSFSVIIFIWELVVIYSGWSSQVFPGPIAVFNSFIELVANGSLINHSVASLYRVTIGFYIGALLGVPLGILLGRITAIKFLINPVIQFLRPISPLAWIPLSMLWFGIGDQPAI
ncbi:MAG: ABC transporter permease, partial [Gammaproteobacteria bacterium]|nr:ABC transporter permease [Gammaproteobacteria bacterium]